MTEETKSVQPHQLLLEGRARLTVSGVTEIDSFDEQTVLLFSTAGELCIRGEGLHINRIDVDTGELSLEGERIDSIAYADNPSNRVGFFQKLFR